jgi:hypothetical protein
LKGNTLKTIKRTKYIKWFIAGLIILAFNIVFWNVSLKVKSNNVLKDIEEIQRKYRVINILLKGFEDCRESLVDINLIFNTNYSVPDCFIYYRWKTKDCIFVGSDDSNFFIQCENDPRIDFPLDSEEITLFGIVYMVVEVKRGIWIKLHKKYGTDLSYIKYYN